MAYTRQAMSENLARLKDNGHWQYFVATLRETYSQKTAALALSEHPDETLRGECRAYLHLLHIIDTNSGT